MPAFRGGHLLFEWSFCDNKQFFSSKHYMYTPSIHLYLIKIQFNCIQLTSIYEADAVVRHNSTIISQCESFYFFPLKFVYKKENCIIFFCKFIHMSQFTLSANIREYGGSFLLLLRIILKNLLNSGPTLSSNEVTRVISAFGFVCPF